MAPNEYLPNGYVTTFRLVDEIFPLLTPVEVVVLNFANRRIIGSSVDGSAREGFISRSVFALTNLCKSAIDDALNSLQQFHLLEPIGEPTKKGQKWGLAYKDEQGPDVEGLKKRLEDKKDSSKRRLQLVRTTRLSNRTVEIPPVAQDATPKTGTSTALSDRDINTVQDSQQDSESKEKKDKILLSASADAPQEKATNPGSPKKPEPALARGTPEEWTALIHEIAVLWLNQNREQLEKLAASENKTITQRKKDHEDWKRLVGQAMDIASDFRLASAVLNISYKDLKEHIAKMPTWYAKERERRNLEPTSGKFVIGANRLDWMAGYLKYAYANSETTSGAFLVVSKISLMTHPQACLVKSPEGIYRDPEIKGIMSTKDLPRRYSSMGLLSDITVAERKALFEKSPATLEEWDSMSQKLKKQ